MALKGVVSSVYHIRRHMAFFYSNADDVHFDHLVKVVSAKVPH